MPDNPTNSDPQRTTAVHAQAADAGKASLELRNDAEKLRRRTLEVTKQLTSARSGIPDKRFRLAALNLMEDVEDARRRTSTEAEERRRAEKSLHASEARLSAALVAGKMATWDWDPQTDAFIGTATIVEVFGLSGLPPKTLAGRFKQVHPDDLPAYRTAVQESVRTGQGWHLEFRIIRPRDHRVAWLEERAHAAVDSATGNVLFAGVVWDITERKRAEEALRQNEARMRLILESAVEYAILSLDSERRVTMWSAGAERLLGYSQNEILGQSADLIFTEEDRERGAPQHEVDTAVAKGRAADERWHQRKNGERFWGSGVLMSMQDPNGRSGFVKVLRDHTEAKRHEETLSSMLSQLERALLEAQNARREAEEASRAKDTFLAALSHELRTPLTPVLMTAESLLRRKDLPQRARDGLELICRNVELETHFINDLLDVTRIARGKFELLREPLNIHDAIRGAVLICEPDIRGKQQRLSLHLEAIEKIILGDLPRVQQVFWNLLKNSSKFTPERGEIRIITRNEPGHLLVIVSDNGIGIGQTALPDIFDAFQQGESSITRKYGGLGLGLAISRATVNALGGTIEAVSAGAGRGATFTVKFPLTREKDEQRH